LKTSKWKSELPVFKNSWKGVSVDLKTQRYPIVRGPLPPGVVLEEDVHVRMRDGVDLVMDLYHPKESGRYPVLLSMSPYPKEMELHTPYFSHYIEAGATWFFVPRGYVHVIAQVRGSGLSRGHWNMYDIKEQQDGYDLIEWIARQPWCNGNVGMIGDSYFAVNQFLIAAQRPPHLKCIVPWDGGTDAYRDRQYQGGLFYSGGYFPWMSIAIFQCAWPGPVEGKLPPAHIFYDVATHSEDGPYWWERSASSKYDILQTPMLSFVPLTVRHSRGQLEGYSKIKAPKKLVVLPPAPDIPNVHFILNHPANEYILKWLDYWLKGIDTGILNEPPVAIFDSATEEWRYENEYPLERTTWKKFYLRLNSGRPSTQPPYGLIEETAPEGKEAPDCYKTPDSMSLVRAGRPILAYATPPLEKEIRIWGPLSIVLYGSSTEVDTAWFVKIGDVAPDGNIKFLTQGHLKASFREVDKARLKPGQPFHPFRNPVLLEPTKVYEFQIEMMPTFYTFKLKHRIWLQIASDDPDFMRHTIYNEVLHTSVENTIYHDSEYPSHLVLPVIPDSPEIQAVNPLLSAIRWPKEKYKWPPWS
jgi:predicted acyl esterase